MLKATFIIDKKSIIIFLFILYFIMISIKSNNLIGIYNFSKEKTNFKNENSNNIFRNNSNSNESKNVDVYFNKCYIPPDNSNIKIIHLIITRFMIEYWKADDFPRKMYNKDYILNGIRVMKKYLFPSLEKQSCKEFIWVLMLGDKANITYVESLFNFYIPFEYKVIYKHSIKKYVKNITEGFDVLITTRIDYDDRIYYDAVNDVRKAINLYKPMFLYGYNRGVHYYEEDGKYYDFYRNYTNEGVMSIFVSLIIVLNKVNDTYIVYDMGRHPIIKKTLIEKYKSFGIKELNYDPANFDSGEAKFVWVRQNYSGAYYHSKFIKQYLKIYNFNLTKFYGN